MNARFIRLITRRPLAEDSMDHLEPHGAKQDNTHCPAFVTACEQIFETLPLYALDLGCAGGGLVADWTDKGHCAIGLEGSDYPLIHSFGEWPGDGTLRTCDIGRRFTLQLPNLGSTLLFHVITAWAVLEHIPEERVSMLFSNVVRHLRPDGLFFAYIGLQPDPPWHVTVRTKEWWIGQMRQVGLEPLEDWWPFSPEETPRGYGNTTCPFDEDIRNPEQSELGFHLAAARGRW